MAWQSAGMYFAISSRARSVCSENANVLEDLDMGKIRIAIIGYGNVGKYALDAVEQESDMEVAGVVDISSPRLPVTHVRDIEELDHVDVALLCIPTRSIREEAPKYLRRGICTVDCFDMHGEDVWNLKTYLDPICKQSKSAALICAGWDPGSDSIIRAVMNIIVPRGITFTNFGPGMSMGHSVVAKDVDGVDDAVSLTIPLGAGLHRRMVYVKLRPGGEIGDVADQLKSDNYFCKNETHVYSVEKIENYRDMGHKVLIEHKGRSGSTHNQCIHYSHHINNPAATGQVMACAARAVIRQKPGCFTMLEIPLADYLGMPLQDAITHII